MGVDVKGKLLTLTVFFFAFQTFAAQEPTGRYKKIVDQLNALNKQYPAITSIFSIGDNDDGVEIYAMRVSTTPQTPDPKKIGQIIVSTHHGNELAAPLFTMYHLTEILKRYNSTDLYRGNLAETEWTIIPVLNISGYNAANRYEKGYDPNRDYAGPCHSDPGGKVKSIRRLTDFIATRPFAGSLTVHGYVGALTYPWGISLTKVETNDHNAFAQVTKNAAALNGYRHGTSTDIVYPVNGAYEDYAYWKHGMWSLLLELRDGSENDIRTTSEAITYYFDNINSSPSVKNQLTGSCTRSIKPDLHNE